MSDLTKVNEIVFRQLDRLEEASGDALKEEIERARTVKGLADTVISNGNLVLRAAQASAGVAEKVSVPKMISGGE